MLNLELVRRNRKWSQEYVSAHARIDQQHLSAIERGQAWPTPDQRDRLAVVLGVPAETLMEEVQLAKPATAEVGR